MAYACMSILFFKIRKAYGLQRFVRITLFAQLAASLLQLVYHHYEVGLIAASPPPWPPAACWCCRFTT